MIISTDLEKTLDKSQLPFTILNILANYEGNFLKLIKNMFKKKKPIAKHHNSR